MRLAERVPQQAPRTIYRQTAKLAGAGLVERSEEAGVPPSVRYRLTDPAGRRLCRLIRGHIGVAAPEGHPAVMDQMRCTNLYLLAEAWDMGWVEDLSGRGNTITEIAEATTGLTFHQVARRLQLLRSHDLLHETRRRGKGHRYQLTDQARRDVGSLLEVARWLRRYLPGDPVAKTTVCEVVAGLKALIPLARLPISSGRRVELGVAGDLGNGGSKGTKTLTAAVHDEGLFWVEDGAGEGEAWAIGTANTWIAAMLDGSRGRMRVGGDLPLVDSFLRQLRECQQREPTRWQP